MMQTKIAFLAWRCGSSAELEKFRQVQAEPKPLNSGSKRARSTSHPTPTIETSVRQRKNNRNRKLLSSEQTHGLKLAQKSKMTRAISAGTLEYLRRNKIISIL